MNEKKTENSIDGGVTGERFVKEVNLNI